MNLGVLVALIVIGSGVVIVLAVFAYGWLRRRQKAPPHVKPLPPADD